MQKFTNTADGSPWAFEDNVIATKGLSGVYTFAYTTGAREADVITPATYAPDTLGELGEVIEKGAMLTPEVIMPGALIQYPLAGLPSTLVPAT